MARQLLSAKTMMKDPVRNRQDEDLGKIEEFMINPQTGCIAYAVLSFGGFMGMGDKLFAVPMEALKLDQENKRFVMDIDQERLKQAPGFDKDRWPDMDEAYSSKLYEFYHVTPSHQRV